ncbi:NAD(P)-dependent oxidoreductase [Rhodococcus sp. BP-149]|nr:NAD(P)-dependent oxidoreductase [Rhodococcus sp. BP-288]MBY6696041.1 NAD(P)-dependent oxidoreductase [Rhodococcus sp. BP-188]MBY6700638.1 NAD(P)-dependent oxidoreductase [Rhodococcus sp. BP-285]MBY6705035.1 NAD(P)-dependent oxidoreductase [Rhodococcus sp. BP-283]MBY6713763.1 NAD(P)-dependent oxidoreductase [Rhodococcus sp. BP-160]MBY6715621.1 NAD(P)-dependent oxidoreductase [Rhodococcus sp. BP-110]MBY6722077.1 NAD(P)-dependent oxidoreductase [Rhodococcus sp. BP-142]MBY6726603.1 NAD(P)-dep
MVIGFIGAGRMGGPMVSRLAAAGESVVVHTRTPAETVTRADGVATATDLADVVVDAGAVVVCVHTDDQVRAVCFEGGMLEAMRPGSVLIVHTTGDPRTVLGISRAVSHRGIDVVDAPVSGGPHDIEQGRVTTFVGGSADAFTAASAVIGHYSNPRFHTGALGSGQLTKLVNNAVFASNVAVLGAATELGRQFGIDDSVLARCLHRGSASSTALDNVIRAGTFGAFAGAVEEFLAKDIAVVREVAADFDVDMGLLETALDASNRSPHSTTTNGSH